MPGEIPFLYKLHMMKDKVSRKHFLLSFWLAAALTSCGSAEAPQGESASEPPPASGTCALLTADEIEEVLGRAPGAPQAPEGTEDCLWPAADDPSTNLVRLVLSDSGFPSFDSFVVSYQAEFGGEEPPRDYYRPIEGVGDWAMYVADENALQVFKGVRMLQLATNPPNEAQAISLAQKAVPRLP